MTLGAGEWYLVSFLIFVGLIFNPAKKMLMSALTSKADEINKDLIEAQRLKQEAENLYKEAEKRLADAKFEATEIMEHTRAELVKAQRRVESDIEDFTARQNAMLEQRLAEMYHTAKQDIHNHIVDTSIETASQMITERLKKETNAKNAVHELRRVKHLSA